MYPSGMPGACDDHARADRSSPQPTTGLIVKWKLGARRQLPLARRLRHGLRPVRDGRAPRPGRLRHRRDPEPAGRHRRPASTRTSARRSSTWRSTRRTGRSTSRTPTRTTTSASRGTRPASRRSSGTMVDSRITVIDPGLRRDHGRQPELAAQPRRRHRRPDAQPRVPAGPHGLERRQAALRRRAGLEQARHLRHGGARGGHRDADGGEPGHAHRRRPDGRRRERADNVAFVLTRFDDGSRSSTSARGPRRRTSRCSTRSRRASRRAASSSTTRPPRRRSATRRARAATSAATSTVSPGTSATPATSRCRSRRRTPPQSDVFTIPEADIVAAHRAGRRVSVRVLPAGQGPDDDAEPPRPRQRAARCTGAATATAPSSRRACRSSTAAGTRSSRRSRTRGIFDEVNAFVSFNVAFPGLVGDAAGAEHAGHVRLRDVRAADHLPAEPDPQPRRLAHAAQQAAGEAFYFNNIGGTELPVDRFHDCNGCHVLNRAGNAGRDRAPGLLRDRRAALVRERVAESSRSPTSGTRTRRSACTARRSTKCTPSARSSRS